MKRLFISLIEYYQMYLSFDKGLLSVFAPGGACKYSPTCSEYVKQRVKEVGVVKGAWFGMRRIWGCR